jgi:GcrA cell cycle regulator
LRVSVSLSGEEAFVWTDAAVERLKGLLASGTTYDNIVKILDGPTRGAVAGKIHRDGIGKPVYRKHIALVADNTGHEKVVSVTPSVIPASTSAAVQALRRNQCRFPLGIPREAGFYFCNATQNEDSPYCAYHQKVCTARGAAEL